MICRVLLTAGLITVLLGAGPADSGSAADASSKTAAGRALDPKLFSELATGVVLIRTFDCGGSPKTGGSGFLVGMSVVITARHVAFQSKKFACKIKVRVGHPGSRLPRIALARDLYDHVGGRPSDTARAECYVLDAVELARTTEAPGYQAEALLALAEAGARRRRPAATVAIRR